MIGVNLGLSLRSKTIVRCKVKRFFKEPTVVLEDIDDNILTSVGLDWNNEWGDDWAPWND